MYGTIGKVVCALHYVRWEARCDGRYLGVVDACNEAQAIRIAGARYLGIPMGSEGRRPGITVKAS